MKEALVILAVMAVLVGLTAFRYRRQIAAMMHVWRTFKSLRESVKGQPAEITSSERAAGPLVSCAKCRTWTPRDRSVRLGKNTYYCSAKCVEQAVEA